MSDRRWGVYLIPLVVLCGGVILGLAVVVHTFSSLAMVFLFCSMALLILFLVRPDLVVPLLILTIPLEISKTFIPILLLDRDVDGQPASIVDFSRIAMAVGAAAFLVLLSSRKVRVRGILRHQITIASLALLALCIMQGSLMAPSGSRALFEVIRLTTHILILVMSASLLDSAKRIELAMKSFLLSVCGLALLGLYQYVTGDFFWNKALISTDFRRINVTFSDPNIFARYLAIVTIVSWVLLAAKWRWKWLLRISLGASLLALFFTFSRSGWLLLPVGMAIYFWYSSDRERGKVGTQALVIAGITTALFLTTAALKQRAETLSAGVGALDARLDLIKTGVQIYSDHPILGVGLGGFETIALRDYSGFLPQHGRYVTLSHTALVTVMAELGTVGLILTLWIFIAVFISFRRIRNRNSGLVGSFALSCFVAIIFVVLSAQSEGRMFEEPILWIFMGMLIALEKVGNVESLPAGRRG
jgi:putative inorganic carbon (hco3(-)) transporter